MRSVVITGASTGIGWASAKLLLDRGFRAFMLHLGSTGLPAEKIAEKVFAALTLPKPKVHYTIAPDPMRQLMAALSRTLIARRLGLMPQG